MIDFEERNINTPENLEYVKSLGYTAAPVVIAGDRHWSGLKVTELEKLLH